MRLIDGDAFRDLMWSLAYDDWNQGINISLADAFRGCVRRVEEAPTVDAVPVVRCKDCKYVGTDATCCLVCKREGMGLRPFHVYHDDYCSYGERKDGDEHEG